MDLFYFFLRCLYNKINSNTSNYRPVASFFLQGGAIQPEDGPDEVSRGGFGCPPLHFKRFEGCKMLKVKCVNFIKCLNFIIDTFGLETTVSMYFKILE